MAVNRIMRAARVRRALALGALAALSLALGACGSGGGDSTTDRAADVEVLNGILGRQLAAVEAYGRALPALHDAAELAAVHAFRLQEQEHVDATTKTIRGLEGEADPPAEEIPSGPIRTRRQAFEFLYELESATIDAELNAVGRLTIGWPRPLIASMAANQAQHLVLIRQALGAGSFEIVPEPFETGETPAPR